jgi:ferredoxin like protein
MTVPSRPDSPIAATARASARASGVAASIERDPAWAEISFEDRMATVTFDVHPRAHIVVDGAVCADCSTRDCVVACPANLFVPTSDGGILFNYEQCFECGTCYLVCNREGAIAWSYPDGGHGVVLRRS